MATTRPASQTRAVPASQTLSRGIRILEILGAAAGPLSIDEVAQRLDVHRSVAYRLVRTLECHGLLSRDDTGRLNLGAGLAALASGVAHDLQAEALPELTAAAGDLGMTCFLTVLDRDECVTLTSVEPRHAVASVAQRPGSRHPAWHGAPGKALLALLPPGQWPAEVDEAIAREITDAAARGFAQSHDEVIANLHAVAVPLALRGRAPASVAVVYLSSDHRPETLAARLADAATAIRRALDG